MSVQITRRSQKTGKIISACDGMNPDVTETEETYEIVIRSRALNFETTIIIDKEHLTESYLQYCKRRM